MKGIESRVSGYVMQSYIRVEIDYIEIMYESIGIELYILKNLLNIVKRWMHIYMKL